MAAVMRRRANFIGFVEVPLRCEDAIVGRIVFDVTCTPASGAAASGHRILPRGSAGVTRATRLSLSGRVIGTVIRLRANDGALPLQLSRRTRFGPLG